MSQLRPIRTFPSNLLKIHFKITFPQQKQNKKKNKKRYMQIFCELRAFPVTFSDAV
jgi:hypothetical protein